MKLSDILTESKDTGMSVKVRISGADLENIPDSLSYNISDVVLETKAGSVRVPDGGVVSLNISPEVLGKRLAASTEATEVINVQLHNPPSDFRLGSSKSPYSVMVEYVTDEGERKEVEMKFNSIDFTPSDSVESYLNKRM